MRNVAFAWGGGGFRGTTYEAGFLLAALEMGYEPVEHHGVSAGAIITAFAIEEQWAALERLAVAARVSDGHRWLTGIEIAGRALRGKLRALGRNDRLWSNYLEPYIHDDPPAAVPGFVYATDWLTGRYLQIAHYEKDWRHAVWGSATMGPPLWEPVPWQGHLLVDGGYCTQVPLADVLIRIFDAAHKPDLIVAVPSTTGAFPASEGKEDIQQGLLRSLALLAHQVERDDLRESLTPPCPVIVARPTIELGGELEADAALQLKRFQHGRQRAKELLG